MVNGSGQHLLKGHGCDEKYQRSENKNSGNDGQDAGGFLHNKILLFLMGVRI
jgi:hypothetical protein